MSEPAKDEAELAERIAARHYTERLMLDGARPGRTWANLPQDERMMLVEDAKCDLAAIRAAGWAVVPVEPTDEMFEAGHEEVLGGSGVIATYRAMLAAAPEVKQPEPVCVNAHDRCYGGAGGPCPLCEMPATPGVKP